jgi:hypothetical protein
VTPLTDLLLAIAVSAVAVFVVSSALHMLLPLHKGDMRKLPDEDRVLDAMRSHGVGPGDYMFPAPSSMKDMGTPAMIARYQLGPVGTMTVVPNGPYAMGRALAQWFLYSLLINLFVGYAASIVLVPGADGMLVFRLTSTVAILGYAFASVSNSIWKGLAWSTTFKFVFDGVLYGLATAAVFMWMWPAA